MAGGCDVQARHAVQGNIAMRYRLALRLVLLALGAALAACASAVPSSAPAELQISASEFTFEAPQTSFAVGTRYRFVVKNTGQLEHEWLIMPRGERDEDKALIEVEEDDLPTGATVVRELTFTQAGSFEFACHLPGHYEAGMVLPIVVR